MTITKLFQSFFLVSRLIFLGIKIMNEIKCLLALLIIIIFAIWYSVIKIEQEKDEALDMLLRLEKRKEELKLNPQGSMKRIDVPKENTVYKGGIIANGKVYFITENNKATE